MYHTQDRQIHKYNVIILAGVKNFDFTNYKNEHVFRHFRPNDLDFIIRPIPFCLKLSSKIWLTSFLKPLDNQDNALHCLLYTSRCV